MGRASAVPYHLSMGGIVTQRPAGHKGWDGRLAAALGAARVRSRKRQGGGETKLVPQELMP
jgi:hypothetical protein